MFKRVERKRKRQDEDEELGLDQDTREFIGLNDTESDASETDLEGESAQSDASVGEDVDHEEDADEEKGPPISVAEALKDPIYLVSFDPTVYGCVLCKEKLLKNPGMAAAHKNANVHKRRVEHFRLFSNDVDPRSSAWELVKTICSAQGAEPRGLSKRALKRQVKQAAVRDRRKHHKELKIKAVAKHASKKLTTVEDTSLAPSPANFRHPAVQLRKKKKTESNTLITMTTETRRLPAKSASSDGKKRVYKSKGQSTRKANKRIII